MKKDLEVVHMRQERSKGRTQEQAAARGHECPYRPQIQAARQTAQPDQTAAYPSDAPNPFAAAWPWVVAQLERDPALQAKTLFAELVQQHPQRYQPNQLRTLQRHIATWRAQFGPAHAVIFEQVHQPGRLGQSDFTHMEDLQITLAACPSR